MQAFLSALGVLPDALDPTWRAQLAAWFDAAPQHYPTLRVDGEAFQKHVAGLVSTLAPGTHLHMNDLYLAYACGMGDDAALRIFEQERMVDVPLFLAKYTLDVEQVHEALQRIRERLFVWDVGPPRILTYSGQGPLGGWLRMVAVRVTLDMLRQAGHDFEAPELDAVAIDPELALVKSRYAEQFRTAIRNALASLSDRDATLLKLRHAQGLDSAKIAAVYRVSARTVQRWLGDAHEQVNRAVRKELVANRQIEARDLSSVLGLIESQLDITLGALMRNPSG
jgi:RNA polymerase sigma-70 factor, ECF subfamily